MKKPKPVDLEKARHAKAFTTVASDGEILGKFSVPSNLAPSQDEFSTLTTGPLQRITNTTVHPYKAVAYMELEAADGTWWRCTGYFIDDNTILTAAHCVYDTYTNQWRNVAFIWPAKNGDIEPYGVILTGAFQITTDWVNVVPPEPGKLYAYQSYADFAVIYVPDGAATSWFYLRPDGHTVGEQVNATGYPADVTPAYTMWRSLGNTTYLDDLYFVYDSIVKPGMSGGPVFSYRNGGYYAIGINSTGDGAGFASSPRITGPIFYIISQWIIESN